MIAPHSAESPSFPDRTAAGRLLAQRLQHYDHSDAIVLGLPRGGIPVAYEVARALALPLDAFLVRKLGVPHQPELAMGAIASGGIRHLNAQVIESCGIQAATLAATTDQEQRELQRRNQTYRQDRPFPSITDRHIILVDDGIATGASMQVALLALRNQNPQMLTVAVPVAPQSSLSLLSNAADEVICLLCPDQFDSVGQWYSNFTQVSDAEVCELLHSQNP